MTQPATSVGQQTPASEAHPSPGFPWPSLVGLVGIAVAILLFISRKRHDGLKERADALHDLATVYAKLVAEDATILSHESEREEFRMKAERYVDRSSARRCLDAL